MGDVKFPLLDGSGKIGTDQLPDLSGQYAALAAGRVQVGQIPDLSATYTPLNLTGPYGSRPAATAVKAGTLYFATDVPEGYRSDGSAWAVLPSGGMELGYAEITAPFSTTSTTPVNVPGLATTFVVGERPILIRFGASLSNPTAGTIPRANLVLDGTVVGFCGANNSGYASYSRTSRQSGLTPGSTHTVTIQLFTAAGSGTTTMYGGTDDRPAVSVITQ